MDELQEKTRELFEKTKAGSILFRNFEYSADPNFSYFSGLNAENFSNAFIILNKNKKPLLVASHFEEKNANLKFNRLRGVRGFEREKQLLGILKKQLQGKRIGLNLSIYPANSLKKTKKAFKAKFFFDISGQLAELRATKTQSEIKKIKNAVRISEECLQRFPGIIKKAHTEKEAAIEINHCLFRNGAHTLAFPTIVASGKNAAVIHHAPSGKKIKKGELVLVDFGAKANCYCSDLTRMFCVGKPSEKQSQLFGTLLEAKNIAEKTIKPKASGFAVFNEADSFLKKKGFRLQHGLGHGLGVETHDFPDGFRPKSKTILASNMVLTIEPGIYGKFGGIRLEDDIAITDNGFRFLSKPQKELIKI